MKFCILLLLFLFRLGDGRRQLVPRSVWNLSADYAAENEELIHQFSLVRDRPPSSQHSERLLVNVSDDFRLTWSVVWGKGFGGESLQRTGSGSFRLNVPEAKSLAAGTQLLAGDVVLHPSGHPSELSTPWRFQGLFFEKEGTFVGLLHSSTVGVVENVRMELPLSNLTASAALTHLFSLGPNLTSAGWQPFDEFQESSRGVFGRDSGAALPPKVREQLCYFIVKGRAAATLEFAEPWWRRPTTTGRGQANPFVELDIALMRF